ncbi:MAG: hypothetical protein GTN78_13515, partial [Gemmatimonadales bacterium]|nr:hypothetical protein [Gemmatimonadales bacterium]
MSRTATLILMAASAAALLLVASAGKSLWTADAAAGHAAGGVSAAAGFAALVALVVFAAAMAEYLIHARLTYLCVATGFFAAAVMDAWSALVPLRQVGKPGAEIALWYGASITLAAMLACGAVAWHAGTPRRRVGTSAA